MKENVYAAVEEREDPHFIQVSISLGSDVYGDIAFKSSYLYEIVPV